MNRDFLDLLVALSEHGADHLIVGAFAMAAHGVARATGDIDVWVRPTVDNAARVIAALRSFGAPLSAHGVTESTFARPAMVYQMGLPPSRIDILTGVDGLTFDSAWSRRIYASFGPVQVPVLSLEDLRATKAAAGRPKDLADLALLDEVGGR